MKFVLFFALFVSFTCFSQKKKATLESVSKEITADKTSDSAKVRAIYEWITNNINYDYAALMSGEPYRYQSAELVFSRRATTCSGYSHLMIAMLANVGIAAFEIEGYTKDVTLGLDTTLLYADHSWVAFNSNGNWYACDPTWDSGMIGLIKEVQNEGKEKKTFRQRLKNFWYFFWSKKRKAREREKEKNKKPKLKITQKVTYKVGVIRKPSTDYFFIDPSYLVKDHLPLLPQWQMTFLSVEKPAFCDSLNYFGPNPTIGTTASSYQSLNNNYYDLEPKRRELLLSNELIDFNKTNFGDKGHHAFVYLFHETGGKATPPLTMKDSLMKICDGVSYDLKKSIGVLKEYRASKTKLFQRSFLLENTSDKNKQKSLDFMYKVSTRSLVTLEKGILNIYKNRNVKLNDFEGKLSSYPDTLKSLSYLTFQDSALFRNLQHKFDSLVSAIEKRQAFELTIGDSLKKRLISSFNYTISLYEKSFESVQNISFMYEQNIRSCDSVLVAQFKTISKTIQDSVMNYFKLSRSFDMIALTVKELGLAQNKIDAKKEKHSARFFNYYDAKLSALFRTEYEISKKQDVDARNFMNLIKKDVNPFIQIFKTALNHLGGVKKKRQKYLFDYLKMKTNRAVKLYSSELSQTKEIKAKLKQIK